MRHHDSLLNQMALSSTEMYLMGARVAPNTVIAYSKAYDKFKNFITQSAPHMTTETPSDMDKALKSYITHLYETSVNKSRSAAEKAFCAVLFYRPDVKGSLSYSAAMLKGWKNLHPSKSKPPFTWPIVVLLASTMASYGYFDAGLATLLGFDCLLRISEMCNFRVSDVIKPNNQLIGPAAHTNLRIRKAKTGTEQSVAIWNEDVNYLLMIHLDRHRDAGSTKLFAFNGAKYRAIVKNCLSILQLSHLGFTPHSLRHGGATQMLRQQHSAGSIYIRGRWSPTSTTILTYLQVAAAASLDLAVSDAHINKANTILQDFRTRMKTLLFPDISASASD
jgi:integrase